MQVNSIGAGSATASQTAGGSAKNGLDLGYDAFVKMLLAQLKNQDPTKPMDATEYVSQLATLSNLEQVIKQSETLDVLLQRAAFDQGAAVLGMKLTDREQAVSGVVTAVEFLSDGVWASLEDGTKVLVGEGVSISRP